MKCVDFGIDRLMVDLAMCVCAALQKCYFIFVCAIVGRTLRQQVQRVSTFTYLPDA